MSKSKDLSQFKLADTLACLQSVDTRRLDIVKNRIRQIRIMLAETHAPPVPGDYLLVSEQGKSNFWFLLNKTNVMIGRSSKSDLHFSDEKISGCHCKLAACDKYWCITDLNSKNGFTINGKTAEEAILKDGDILSIGSVKLIFLRIIELEKEKFPDLG